jgi:hypothetical protein
MDVLITYEFTQRNTREAECSLNIEIFHVKINRTAEEFVPGAQISLIDFLPKFL